MAEIDVVWLAFGLFLLACGGVPAVAALITERRGRESETRARIRRLQSWRAPPPPIAERLRRRTCGTALRA